MGRTYIKINCCCGQFCKHLLMYKFGPGWLTGDSEPLYSAIARGLICNLLYTWHTGTKVALPGSPGKHAHLTGYSKLLVSGAWNTSTGLSLGKTEAERMTRVINHNAKVYKMVTHSCNKYTSTGT